MTAASVGVPFTGRSDRRSSRPLGRSGNWSGSEVKLEPGRGSVVARGRGQLPRGRCCHAFYLGRIEQLDGRTRHDGADGVLIHELGMPIPAKQNGKIVKPGDDPLKLDTVHKEN